MAGVFIAVTRWAVPAWRGAVRDGVGQVTPATSTTTPTVTIGTMDGGD